MSVYNSDFECTPQQYHANLSRLWELIGNPECNGEDVFTRVIGEMEKLRKQKAELLEACESARYIFEDSDNWNVKSFERILQAMEKARGE